MNSTRVSSGYTNNDTYPITGYDNTDLIAPSGYIELDDSMNKKNAPSRETITSKEDISYYFNKILVPKYGLDNLNVNNVGSFMKELEMNWSRLTPELKDKSLDIIVIILGKNLDLKNALMNKLGPTEQVVSPEVTQNSSFNGVKKENFSEVKKNETMLNIVIILSFVVFVGLLFYFYTKK